MASRKSTKLVWKRKRRNKEDAATMLKHSNAYE